MAIITGKSKYFSSNELIRMDVEGMSAPEAFLITPARLDAIIDNAQPSKMESLKSSNKMLKDILGAKERKILSLSQELSDMKHILDAYRLEIDGYSEAEGFCLSKCLLDVLKRSDKIIMDKSRNEIDLEGVLRDYERKELITDDFINGVSRLAKKYPEFEKGYHTILCSYERSLYDKQ